MSRSVSIQSSGALTRLGWIGVGALVVALGLAVAASLWKLLAIGGVAFAAMAGGAYLGTRSHRDERGGSERRARGLAWGYGGASGAMIVSTGAFLIPSAIGHHAAVGGFGIAGGILLGFVLHAAQHQLAHLHLPFDATTLELTAHSLAAGLVIGAVYATMPALGPALGLAIVSHKAPAGYAAARRLARSGQPTSVLLLPAAAVAAAAVPVGLLSPPSGDAVHASVFGLATGIFLHVALDFLPRCEIGGEISEAAGLTNPSPSDTSFDAHHHLLDRLRLHAVASALFGGLLVFGAWWGLPT
ncbi:MAG: ZIP family metal transporter [Bacteroidetes bacterium QS_1_63_11]|nr:MAG: ZIP family metal transporter [Bacteroidetes bacterium QS_1_63_11]